MGINSVSGHIFIYNDYAGDSIVYWMNFQWEVLNLSSQITGSERWLLKYSTVYIIVYIMYNHGNIPIYI